MAASLVYHSDRNPALAARLEDILENRTGEITRREGVIGAGVGWRDDRMKFVVVAESIAQAEQLKHSLPDAVDGFPLYVEVGRVARAAGRTSDAGAPPPAPGGFFARIGAWLRGERWLGYRAAPRHTPRSRHVVPS